MCCRHYHPDSRPDMRSNHVRKTRIVSIGVAVVCTTAVLGASPVTASKPGSGSSTGTGLVFKVNPVQSSGDQSLTDQKDAASAVPSSEYARVEIRNLDGSGYLSGKWANVRSETGNPAYSQTNTYLYDRRQDEFEQTMAYFWINQAQEYLQSLGFGSDLPPILMRPFDVRINQYGADNSYFWSKHQYVRLGKGGVDDAEDAEVIWHEYGHAIQDAQVPGYGSGNEAGAIGEGFGDWWAMIMSAPNNPDTATTPLACIADWDAVSYDSTKPYCLRRVDGTKIYPRDMQNEVHRDGEIWSRALWDIYQGLGRDRSATIVLEAQFSYAPNTSFRAAAQTTVDTARRLYGDAAATTCSNAFQARGIL